MRRSVLSVLLLIGIGLIVAPLSMSMFSRAWPKLGQRLTTPPTPVTD